MWPDAPLPDSSPPKQLTKDLTSRIACQSPRRTRIRCNNSHLQGLLERQQQPIALSRGVHTAEAEELFTSYIPRLQDCKIVADRQSDRRLWRPATETITCDLGESSTIWARRIHPAADRIDASCLRLGPNRATAVDQSRDFDS